MPALLHSIPSVDEATYVGGDCGQSSRLCAGERDERADANPGPS
jgi:hypothetical protein